MAEEDDGKLFDRPSIGDVTGVTEAKSVASREELTPVVPVSLEGSVPPSKVSDASLVQIVAHATPQVEAPAAVSPPKRGPRGTAVITMIAVAIMAAALTVSAMLDAPAPVPPQAASTEPPPPAAPRVEARPPALAAPDEAPPANHEAPPREKRSRPAPRVTREDAPPTSAVPAAPGALDLDQIGARALALRRALPPGDPRESAVRKVLARITWLRSSVESPPSPDQLAELAKQLDALE